ncbi:MAG TPA: 2-C-methyl-D-erythritol 4-phosphate cytidylyltransferase [Actinomycetota bacterium]|nr:2-C-methyl-D-erythritol 4-phosphate cytidylyltransferase [Actinomycetota bacterium]
MGSTEPGTRPAAILAAGGIGERARSDPSEPPKQFQLLAGRPVIQWALEPLIAVGCDPIVVVLPGQWIAQAEEMLEGPQLLFAIGGATRQESIHNGLELVTTPTVVVQDASRPLIDADLIRKVVGGLATSDAVIAAVPMDETLKRAKEGLVVETVDRAGVWKAQTPAAFRTDVLKAAHERAVAEGFVGTDEAQLIERYGGSVSLVPGSRRNLKITWAEDFELAEALLKVGG